MLGSVRHRTSVLFLALLIVKVVPIPIWQAKKFRKFSFVELYRAVPALKFKNDIYTFQCVVAVPVVSLQWIVQYILGAYSIQT